MNYDLMEGRASYPSLKDKHVFITGGASGIGRSLVEHFVDQGSVVTFVDLNDDAAADVIKGCVARGGRPPVYQYLNLRNVEALEAFITKSGVERGPISVLVNNAGNDDRHQLSEVTSEYFDDRIAVNLRHQVFAAKAVVSQMKGLGGGSIINLSSITWMEADGDGVCYVTAKAAVHGMTRALARELGPDNIRVNSIAPGWIMTERQVDLWLTPEGEKQIDARQVLPGRIYPPEIARMALFLASDDSRMISKQSFIVDAGWI
ncbi:SDR family oxidoreductase [Shinella yambaruensis]|uniref:3-oxoacyl-ACP reductase n=1 Tax=Shinella yambaruensis TaxID=415996 RepID=A0ABQ5ZFX5_9HYPH|nr:MULTISPECIES: SDR family oxidoreductase [Shinella]CAI0336220.1 D-xylose 1-dehydrogenase [Rhizobiaceae bacterium]CAK7254766.1 D-xylose 1-dehydrogenase [Shinella sp. WSC3-e]MCJ8026660.1 SDR family oxidoreductase [Shinella yambaruensis]MCO5136737.1 SDR family oxidoreductase [Shinella sp.]MCU7983672.1 SDR family oxidoreductase [Shinella yambaruensis]